MATAKLMAINKLCEGKDGEPYTFFIPSYQRGYRWEEEQIINLAKDLYEFVTNENRQKDDYYYLQPIVVKNRKDEKNEKTNVWEVVDGQQRLTALWIFYTIYYGRSIRNGDEKAQIKYNLTYEEKPEFDDLLTSSRIISL